MKITMLMALLAITGFAVMVPAIRRICWRRVAHTDSGLRLTPPARLHSKQVLRTTTLNGTADSPVTNIRMVVKNSGAISYAFVSGWLLSTTAAA